ncbi:MAG: Hpt domain-containing protein [Burkholderiales bacterium]|nr:Hpt domain-containing protein [Burkholderiales bacterium]
MAIDIPLELDSGPITWVKAEIDSALIRALENIERLRSTPTEELKVAVRSDLHQVSGAFELVGIEGLAILIQEFERHFAPEIGVVPRESLDLVDRACRRLLSHLKEMASGTPPVPLRFISEYLALGKLRGAKYGPADLFFPDLSRKPARLESGQSPEPSRMPSFLLRQRRDFQHGLLQWLRGSGEGLEQMRRVIAEIESAYPLPSQRSFWWATHALLEAIRSGVLEPMNAHKQLMARIDLQMRRFVEGSTRVADRLRREVLYHVARARNHNPLVDEVKKLYELDVLVPKRIPREIDVVALQPAIDNINAVVARCKEAWSNVNAGRSNAHAKLRDATAQLPVACDGLRLPEFAALARGIAQAAAGVADGKPVTEDLSIEFATSLILVEMAMEHIAAPPATLRAQIDRALQRLNYAASNVPIPEELRSDHEDNSLIRLANERQTIAHVSREIRANMRLVEQALDTVFRDHSAVDELKPVPSLLGQVSGAMRMLGWNDANDLLNATSERLIEAIRGRSALETHDIDALADVLAGLSFYVDVRERREKDADEILARLQRRLAGESADKLRVVDEESVEASLAERQRQLRALARVLQDEGDSGELRGALRATLDGIRQDAELISDDRLSASAVHALHEIDRDGELDDALKAAVAAVAGSGVAAPPVSAETTRLVESRAEERDSALLDIFTEEAGDVVESVGAQLAELRSHRDQRSVLTDIRRAFHTLKGSGRMVGQSDLAEAAWRVERVLNRALEQDRPASDAELQLIDVAYSQFGVWVAALRSGQPLAVDVAAFDAQIERCAAGLDVQTPAPAGAAPHNTPEPPAGLSLSAPAPVIADIVPTFNWPSGEPDWAAPTAEVSLPTLELAAEHQDLHSVLDAYDDELNILGVRVSRALFAILTDETRVHLQTLEYELTLMQFDPTMTPSDAMVRASHTLCGIHRTAGFAAIGDFAGLLESALMSVRRCGRGDQTLTTLSAAVQCLRTSTLRLQAHSALSAEEIADQEFATLQLQALIAETGSPVHGVEAELAAQTHAEEQQSLAGLTGGIEASPHPDGAVTGPKAHASATESPPLTVLAASTEVVAVADPPPLASPVASAADSPHASPLAASSGESTTVTPPTPDHPDVAAIVPAAQPTTGTSARPGSAAALAAAAAVSGVVASSLTAAIHEPERGERSQTSAVTTPIAPARAIEDPLRDVHDDLDEQVLPIFLEEAQDLFPRAGEQVNAWRRDRQTAAHAEALKRTLHTLKGSARMAGAMRLGELAHGLETRLLEVQGAPTAAVFDGFDESLDDMAYLLERLTHGESDVILPRFAPESSPAAQVAPVPPDTTVGGAEMATTAPISAGESPTPTATVPMVRVAPTAPSITEIAQRLALRQTATAAAPAVAETPEAAAAILRVRSDAVEQLADEAGEISITRSRIEAEMRNLKGGLLDLTSSVVRLRGQLREIEIQGESQIQSRLDQESQFDPLEFDRYTRFQELTRGLAEGVNDVATVQQSLLKNLSDAENALSTQTRLSRSVQLRLQTMRTVPFANLSDRLYRVLRQTAKDVKKRANLDIRGGRIEIDRSVLERLTPVLEHLVRNALAHGIEPQDVRQQRNKPEIGELTLSVRQQGNEVAISLADDGDGIALDRVRARAVATGLLAADEAVSESRLLEFIFQSGFSTSEEVTAVAGRGVGMDVVRSEVTALGGRVDVRSQTGLGTTFTLSVPLTLAVTQVLLVGVGKATFGIPSSIVEQVRQIPIAERTAAAAAGSLQHVGQTVPYRTFAALAQIAATPGVQRTAPVLIVRSGELMVAVEVDRIINNQEVVAKPYGPQLARVPGLVGLTVLANGMITPLMNPVNLMLTQEAGAVVQQTSVAPEVASLIVTTQVEDHAAKEVSLPRETATTAPLVAPEVDDVVSAVMPPAVDVPAALDGLLAFEDSLADASTRVAPAPHVATVTPLTPHTPVNLPEATIAPRIPVVLVVDDSLTVRKITSRLLEREGYRALTAKDGLDALQVLADNNPDVILLDIEMPRMDGFEFTKTIKADNRQNNIPIIMITSRTAEKHRSHAMELGVNEYLGKPYQDEQLLALVAQYAGKPA